MGEGDLGGDWKERKNNNTYVHVHRYISTTRKSKQGKFYVPVEFEVVLERLEIVLKREGKSFSEWIRDQAREYVRVHEPGNPQTTLPKILTLSGAVRLGPSVPRCGYVHNFAAKLGVYCSREGIWVKIEKCKKCWRGAWENWKGRK